jgi:hypothetical protein
VGFYAGRITVEHIALARPVELAVDVFPAAVLCCWISRPGLAMLVRGFQEAIVT